MTILDEMEVALRFYANRENVTYSHPYGEGDTIVGPASKALREYESLKGQIAVVPVQTSEARKAALQWFNGRVEIFSAKHPQQIPYIKTIEAALRQPDTSEAVRVLVGAIEKSIRFYKDPEAFTPDEAIEVIGEVLNHPAVIAAMKGE